MRQKLTMCDHEEVLDSEGYVCIKCGVVLDQEYVYGGNYFIKEIDGGIDHNSNSIICTISDHLRRSTTYIKCLLINYY